MQSEESEERKQFLLKMPPYSVQNSDVASKKNTKRSFIPEQITLMIATDIKERIKVGKSKKT